MWLVQERTQMIFRLKILGAVILAILVFAAMMITAANFCPPEHLVRELMEKSK